MADCESCQQPTDRPELTEPWEDGNNPDAYWRCPKCGHENIVFGYGGDDDD